MKIKYFILPSGIGATVAQDYLLDHPKDTVILDYDMLTPHFETDAQSIINVLTSNIDESIEFINGGRVNSGNPLVTNVHVVKTLGDVNSIKELDVILKGNGFDVITIEKETFTQEDQENIIKVLTNDHVTFADALLHRKECMGDQDGCLMTRIESGQVETSSPGHVNLTEEELQAQNDMVRALPPIEDI